MGRGKKAMQSVPNEKDRKKTFQKRKSNIIKKVYEFSTLCDVDICAISYAPNFEGQGLAQPETWPHNTREVTRIIQKYIDAPPDRPPKIFDVQDYYKGKIKKVEANISKVRKKKLKIMYPTWDDSFTALDEDQFTMLIGKLDAKLDACNQKLDMFKGDPKGKAIAESDKLDTLSPYLASNPSSHLNFMQIMSQPQPFHLPVELISDNNQLPFSTFEHGQSSQSMLHFGQNSTQFMGNIDIVGWPDQLGHVTYDPKTDIVKENNTFAENIQDYLPSYYNGNIRTMQPYNIIAPETLPSQNSQYEPRFHTASDLPSDFQLNGFYDTNLLQAQMFNYMHGNN